MLHLYSLTSHQFPGLTIDRVRKIDPTGIDVASSNIDANIVKLDKENVRLFIDYDEPNENLLVIGRDKADQLITLRQGSFNISRRDGNGKRFILYLIDEERRSTDETGVQPFPFYVFDLESNTVATVFLEFFMALADQQTLHSLWFYRPILAKLA